MDELGCPHESTRLDDPEIIRESQSENVIIQYKEVCNECEEKIGHELQVFKFSHYLE